MIKITYHKLAASLLGAVALAASLIAAPAVHAAVLSIDTAGIITNGEFGDPTNTVLNFNVGANAHITGLGFDVNLTAFDPSYLSEIQISFTPSDTNADGVFLTPGVGDDGPGTASYSSGGIIDLATVVPGNPLDFFVGADGVLRLEFFEAFQDASVNPNGQFNSGSTLSVQYDAVPEPSTWAMLGLGTLGAATVVLRRKRTV